MPICPVCNTTLKTITQKHIDTNKHQNNLKKAGIEPSKDPTIKLIPQPSRSKGSRKARIQKSTKIESSKLFEQLNKKFTVFEKIIEDLQKNQKEIVKRINLINKRINLESVEDSKRKLKIDDIVRAINKCIQNNNNESRWVKLDDIISILKLNREIDRVNLNKLLIKMFNKNLIDLAEGGNPKYPLIYQNRVFGMLTFQ
ncbi:MAG: hypothetical protein ACTSRI_20945 [Promethearchaeota archaeon]